MFGKKSLSNDERMARKMALRGLRKEATAGMGDELKGLKKVTVASNDKKGLELGLDKAKSLLEAKESMEGPEDEAMESPEEQALEDALGTEQHHEAAEAAQADKSLAPKDGLDLGDAPKLDEAHDMAEGEGLGEDMSLDEVEATLAHLTKLREKLLSK